MCRPNPRCSSTLDRRQARNLCEQPHRIRGLTRDGLQDVWSMKGQDLCPHTGWKHGIKAYCAFGAANHGRRLAHKLCESQANLHSDLTPDC